MGWHQEGDKPLPEPMMTTLTDAYMRYQAPVWQYRNLVRKFQFDDNMLGVYCCFLSPSGRITRMYSNNVFRVAFA